ncbi:MAG: NAD-dependent epimerase/dehydratase family protein, partial [Acidobacteria bacterium]|nr:NAD-dependent epimerase/dehydratase family protein [Acidobacteriota bacterium]
MARYLITGVAGFIGSSLAHELLQQGHEVIGVDNLTAGDVHNLDGIIRDLDFRVMDVNETSRLRECCRGVDFVLHQAALASVPRSVRDPLSTHVANVDGTLSVLLAARDAGVSRVVYAASSSAYGNKSSQPKHEEMLPDPLSPYAAQKLAGEYYVRSFWHVYGLEGVCLRYFNVFGPRQSSDSPYSGVIAKFASEMLKGESPLIFGDGNQSRDFTSIDNVVSANLLACTTPAAEV